MTHPLFRVFTQFHFHATHHVIGTVYLISRSRYLPYRTFLKKRNKEKKTKKYIKKESIIWSSLTTY